MDSTYVRSLFDAIAHRYDFLNHLLSGGADLYWRRKAVDQLQKSRPRRILDVACGTADFSIAATALDPESIIGVDIAERMLDIGRDKVRRKGLESLIRLERGAAENLPFDSGSFDSVIVAFGVRNFQDLKKGLSEINRVLGPGGRIVVLEFSRPAAFPFDQIYFFYFKNLLPLIGRIVSRHREAYVYLRDSVMKFPEGEKFLAELREAGFRDLQQERLSFGITTIYSGTR